MNVQYMSLDEQARFAEKASNWGEAARLWKLGGRHSDAEACQMIHDANKQGDEYRAKVLAVAGPEPDVCGDPTDSIKWTAWYKKMSEVYREMFGSPSRKN